MTFNELNAHPLDSRLNFDAETHTYTVGNKVLKSVTSLVEDCFPKFDADYWASRKAPALGVSPADLKASWERDARKARDLGTAMHKKIEHYYLGNDTGDDGEAYAMFRHFAAAEQLFPFRTEWRIYLEDYGVAGTLDFLEKRPDGTFNIYDWKRSKKLVGADGTILKHNRFGNKGLHPIGHIDDTPYFHYALQVSIYRFILETRYDITVNGMKLGVFHPENPMAYIIPLPYLRNEAEALLGKCASGN